MAIDVSTFNFYFKRYYSWLCHTANKFLHDRDEAEDIVQDTFLALYLRMDRTDISTIKSFLTITVLNKCRNVRRHQKVTRSFETSFIYLCGRQEKGVLDKLVHSEFIFLVMEEIEKLPTSRKNIFKMAWIDELKNKEIADKLNLSIYTVKEAKCEGLKQMRKAFAHLNIPDKI